MSENTIIISKNTIGYTDSDSFKGELEDALRSKPWKVTMKSMWVLGSVPVGVSLIM